MLTSSGMRCSRTPDSPFSIHTAGKTGLITAVHPLQSSALIYYMKGHNLPIGHSKKIVNVMAAWHFGQRMLTPQPSAECS